MKAFDLFGREIKAGDYIAYPMLLDRSAAMKFGKVVKVSEAKNRWSDKKKEAHVTVQGIEKSWDVWKRNEKKGTILFPDRIVIIEKDSIPPVLLRLLEDELFSKDGETFIYGHCLGCDQFEDYDKNGMKMPDNCCKYLCNCGKCPYEKEISDKHPVVRAHKKKLPSE